MADRSELVLAALKDKPGSTIRELCAKVSGTRYEISMTLVTLRELGKVDATDDPNPFSRQWSLKAAGTGNR